MMICLDWMLIEDEIAYLGQVNELINTSDLNKNFSNIKDIRFLDNSLDVNRTQP